MRRLAPIPLALAALFNASVTTRADQLLPQGRNLDSGVNAMGDVSTMRLKAPGAGTVVRTLAQRAGDELRAADFGVRCDGTTNDTTAAQAALTAAAGRTLVFPKGTCLIDRLQYAPAPSQPVTLRGEGKGATILRKPAANSSGLLTLGRNPSGGPYYDIRIEGLTIDGADNAVTPYALTAYDLWRFTLRDVELKNAIVGFECDGCIYVHFDASLSQKNRTGMRFRKLVNSGHGNTPPNLLQVNASQIIYNTFLGIDFDDGALLSIRGSNVEYNGTTAGAVDGGGVLAGPSVGTFNAGTLVPGLLIEDTWMEGNRGESNIIQKSGRGSYRNLLIWSAGSETTHDFKITGGAYVIDNVAVADTKKSGLFEGPNVSFGNVIMATQGMALNVDKEKTTITTPRGRGARLRLRAQTIANDTLSLLAWGSPEFDPEGLQTNPNNICIPAGIDRARVTAGMGWASNGSGIRRLVIRKNKTDVAISAVPALGFNFTTLDTGVIPVIQGDCFSTYAYQNSGAPLQTQNNYADFWSVELIR